MKTVTGRRRAAFLHAGLVPLAAVIVVALAACNAKTSSSPPAAPPPPAPPAGSTQATYKVTVTYDPQSKQVAVSPMTVDVASGVTATVTWVSGASGFKVTTVRECNGGGFSSSSTTADGTISVTDNNTGSSTSGDWPYQVSITDGQTTYSSPSCTSPPGTQRPIIRNH